jgi:predicted SAM-dependent methyltransferase
MLRFSLSLMGLNYADYLKEAHRTLRFGGFLKIAEPSVVGKTNVQTTFGNYRGWLSACQQC